MPNMKKINDWINAINNYYAFALLLYGAALYVSSLSHAFVIVFMIATPVIAGWGGYLFKSFIDKRTLRHGFKVRSEQIEYQIQAGRRYALRYKTKLEAHADSLMVYSYSYQWTGEGDESMPKLRGKGMQLMSPLTATRKLVPYHIASGSTTGDWRYWFIAINPPTNKGDVIEIDYTQDFYDKKNEAKPYLYHFVRVPMERLTLSVSFSKNDTPTDVEGSFIKPSQPSRPYAASGVEYDPSRRWATWTIEHPKVGYCYRIHWKSDKKA